VAVGTPAADLLPGAARLAALHAAELPHKDELCGAFCTLLALRGAGIDVPDQDAVAELAGAVLAPAGHDHTAELPAGEPGRRDYRLSLPATTDAAAAGTAPAGLVRALGELSGGTLEAIPVAGPWSAAGVEDVLRVAVDAEAFVVLNLTTGLLWGSRPSLASLLGYLESGDDSAGPPPDWDVGHYTGCQGAIRGTAGTLIVIADTYPSLGWGGVHLQPIERVATALRREHLPTDGGALLIVSESRSTSARESLKQAGLTVAVWDNGSPDAHADTRN
jgi:hypothetical protein